MRAQTIKNVPVKRNIINNNKIASHLLIPRFLDSLQRVYCKGAEQSGAWKQRSKRACKGYIKTLKGTQILQACIQQEEEQQ